MKITPASAVSQKRGPADYFTGTVWLEAITGTPQLGNVRVVVATFEASARPAWQGHVSDGDNEAG